MKSNETGSGNDPEHKTPDGRRLSSLAAGQCAPVCALDGGRSFRSRAANLGFTAGVLVTVMQNSGRGPMIVALRGTRVALGRDEAALVLVEA